MEASLNLLGVCFATVKELFLLYLSSLKACGPAIQYPKLAGNRGRGRGGIHGQNSRLMKDQKKKKKSFLLRPLQTHPRNLQHVKKSSIANCRRKFSFDSTHGFQLSNYNS